MHLKELSAYVATCVCRYGRKDPAYGIFLSGSIITRGNKILSCVFYVRTTAANVVSALPTGRQLTPVILLRHVSALRVSDNCGEGVILRAHSTPTRFAITRHHLSDFPVAVLWHDYTGGLTRSNETDTGLVTAPDWSAGLGSLWASAIKPHLNPIYARFSWIALSG